jgi:hypothetical protein
MRCQVYDVRKSEIVERLRLQNFVHRTSNK